MREFSCPPLFFFFLWKELFPINFYRDVVSVILVIIDQSIWEISWLDKERRDCVLDLKSDRTFS